MTLDAELRNKVGASRLVSLIRAGYRLRQYDHSWIMDRVANDFASDIRRKPSPTLPQLTEGQWIQFGKDFITWVKTHANEVELWLVNKSPAVACKLAVSYETRLHAEAEKIIIEKAKDKAGLLEYCTTFGIVLPDLTNVTLKAAFGEGDREKRYIKKLEETKRSLKHFLVQLLNAQQIQSGQTVEELVRVL
jgi:hypothetical protein